MTASATGDQANGLFVKEVQVYSSDIEQIKFVYYNGGSHVAGDSDEEMQKPFTLLPDEYIVAVRGNQGQQLNQVVFITNTGRTSIEYGDGGADGVPFEFEVGTNDQVVGVERDNEICGPITGLVLQPLPVQNTNVTQSVGVKVGLKVPSQLKVVSKKKHLIEDLELTNLPNSYVSNTTKEETILEYVEDFRRQFVQVFPDRRPLLLCPLNEAKVRKFVCSTVRPTLLPYNAVYNMNEAAEFIADFLEYMPLDEPTRLPDILPSPTTTIQLRAGDCLDFANVLTSLLRGAAYDAYVVTGYAPKWVCVQDQTNLDCPILEETENPLDKERRLKEEKERKEEEETEAARAAKRKKKRRAEGEEGEEGTMEGEEVEEEEEEDEEPKEKYGKKRQPDHTSSFLVMSKQQIKEESEKKRKDADQKSQFVENVLDDPLEGNRVHCWVLVMAGKRGVEQNFFIEPTTGTVYPVEESPYLGIESVWNEENYWANVQVGKPQSMSYDLSDNNNWEYVMIEEQKAELANADPDAELAEDEQPEEDKTPEEFDDRDILDCPMSWCKRIVIDRLMFRQRYPTQSRVTHYKKCTVQKFSPHQESQNGLILRVLIFQTEECITPIEIREQFAHREDKLQWRYVYPLAGRQHMMFLPGRRYGLKDYIVEEKRRCYTFFPKARVDGMVIRNELIGEKVVEEFEERDDFMVYRSVKVAADPMNGTSAYTIELADPDRLEDAGGDGTQDRGLPVLKITQKFRRNEKLEANKDVRKRTHFLSEQTIRLDYHYAKRSITAPSLELNKNDPEIGNNTLGDLHHDLSVGRGDASEKPPNPDAKEHKELLANLVMKEKDLLSEVRQNEKEMQKLLKELKEESLHVKMAKTIYDLAQEQSNNDEDGQEDQVDEKMDRNKVDYLSPFLAQYKTMKLDYRMAMTAKDECLLALKERLLERANIIQQHLDDENQKLHQRRTMFKRQTGSGPVELDEEFTKFYKQCAFRIDILRARLARHEELAVIKYVQMDKQLNEDPRLAALKQGPDVIAR
jgi:hypothetical protein